MTKLGFGLAMVPLLAACGAEQNNAVAVEEAAVVTPFEFPMRAEDLRHGGMWRVSNDHYDMSVVRYDEAADRWTRFEPGADEAADIPSTHLAYGLPVYSYVSGEVVTCWRNAPDNPPNLPHPGRDGCNDEDGDGNVCDQYEECSCTVPRSGNHLNILTPSGEIFLFAHFAPGSVPDELCPHEGLFVTNANFKDPSLGPGDGHNPDMFIPEGMRPTVTAGQRIGRVGHSGASSWPHLHNHGVYYLEDEKFDIPYKRVWTQEYPGGSTNISTDDWTKLNGVPVWDPDSVLMPYYTAGMAELAWHGFPANKYQWHFTHVTSSGYYLASIDGYQLNGQVYFNLVFRPNDGLLRRYYHGLTEVDYEARIDEADEDGYRLTYVNAYEQGSGKRYAAIFTKDNGPAVLEYHDATVAEHDAFFDDYRARGYKPKVVSVVSLNGVRKYAAIWEQVSAGSWELRSSMTEAEYQAAYDANKGAGRKLAYLGSFTHNGDARITAIFKSNAPAVQKAKHGLSGAGYQNEWNAAIEDNFKTRSVTAYFNGNALRFAAYWTN